MTDFQFLITVGLFIIAVITLHIRLTGLRQQHVDRAVADATEKLSLKKDIAALQEKFTTLENHMNKELAAFHELLKQIVDKLPKPRNRSQN